MNTCETKRILVQCVQEHKRAVRNADTSKNEIADHSWTKDHQFIAIHLSWHTLVLSVWLDTVVFYVTHELVVQRREDHGIYQDLNSHLLTLTQLAEESTALTVCPYLVGLKIINLIGMERK